MPAPRLCALPGVNGGGGIRSGIGRGLGGHGCTSGSDSVSLKGTEGIPWADTAAWLLLDDNSPVYMGSVVAVPAVYVSWCSCTVCIGLIDDVAAPCVAAG